MKGFLALEVDLCSVSPRPQVNLSVPMGLLSIEVTLDPNFRVSTCRRLLAEVIGGVQ